MESIELKKTTKQTGFFNHVFDFGDDTKNSLLNIVQYSVLAIIPVILLNKSVQAITTEPSEKKGSIEICAEILFQVIFMFIGLFIIHRIITYLPNYSNTEYSEFNVTNIILAFLVIVLSLQTRLGEKANIIYNRILDTIEGKVNNKEEKKKQSQQNNNNANHMITNVHPNQQISQNINQIVPNNNPTGMQNIPAQQSSNNQSVQQQQQFTPMGIMAANEALGGSFGSSF